MNLSKNSVQALVNIQHLLSEAELNFNSLTSEENHRVFDFHNENYSLNHCIRWGLTAVEELLEAVHVVDPEKSSVVVGEDLKEYVKENIESIVENHLEVWKERYFRKKLEAVVLDVRVNLDKDADIESIEDQLGRKLTDDERKFYWDEFITELEDSYYQ